MVYDAFTFKRKKIYDIKLRRSQVMLYVDQCGRAK